MEKFKTNDESHNHSLKTLNLLYEYDSFLDSLEVVADMGCGHGHDVNWWATLTTRDDPPEPHNYITYAVDKNVAGIGNEIRSLPNVHIFEADFEKRVLPRAADLIWCHDAFQYVTSPLTTLAVWNESMNVNGLLCLTVPQSSGFEYGRYIANSYNYCYYNYNMVSLMYMLAVSGFDCRDAYFHKAEQDPWMHIAVYKSDIAPMDPTTTSWYDLADKKLISDKAIKSLTDFGYVRQQDLLTLWLDKDFHFIKD